MSIDVNCFVTYMDPQRGWRTERVVEISCDGLKTINAIGDVNNVEFSWVIDVLPPRNGCEQNDNNRKEWYF